MTSDKRRQWKLRAILWPTGAAIGATFEYLISLIDGENSTGYTLTWMVAGAIIGILSVESRLRRPVDQGDQD